MDEWERGFSWPWPFTRMKRAPSLCEYYSIFGQERPSCAEDVLMTVCKALLALALAAASLAGPLWAAPPQPSSTPAPVGHPAPVWRFDGEDFYLIDRKAQPGQRILAFLRDGDSPDTCSRRLWLRKVACKDLRSYEKSYTAKWDQTQRDIVYRSKLKLVHSGWVQQGELLQWRLMHWELQGGALICAEFELLSRPPSGDRKTMAGLVDRQYQGWRNQLATIMKQAPALLNVR